MPRYSLRTLIIVMLLGGPVLAGAWWLVKSGIVPPYVAVAACLGVWALVAEWLAVVWQTKD
jgi:hypothetical protein